MGLRRRGGTGLLLRVTHCESKDDVEEEAQDVGESHGHGDRPWGFDLWLVDSNDC